MPRTPAHTVDMHRPKERRSVVKAMRSFRAELNYHCSEDLASARTKKVQPSLDYHISYGELCDQMPTSPSHGNRNFVCML